MATNIQLLSFFVLTFLLTNQPLTSARDLPLSDITLVTQPEENYYIVRRKPVVITCEARNAADIIFTCMGTQIPPSSIEMEDVSDIDPTLLQAKIEVTRADVQNYNDGEEPFWCECSALDVDSQVAITSRRAFITIASLKHKFQIQPESVGATEGENVEFACGAPMGNPEPEIIWRKDKKRLNIDDNSRLLVTDLGSLVIESVTKEDAGHYQCVAKNEFGRRESREAELTVTVLAESAEPEVEISDSAAAVGKPRVPRQSTESLFTVEPLESYTVTQDQPVTIACGVLYADILTFRCNGKRVDPKRQTTEQGMDSQKNKVIQSHVNVTFSEVRDFLAGSVGQAKFQCICVAWKQAEGGWQSRNTRDDAGFVYLAYLDENFQAEPEDVYAGRGYDATLVCEPPRGQPSPWVQWYKDRVEIDPRQDTRYALNAKGHLTISNVQDSDAGNYNCVAQNTVTSRVSRYGRLIVTDDAPTTTAASSSAEGEYVPTFPDVIPRAATFLRNLDAENFLDAAGKKKLVCAAIGAEHLTIDCGGARLGTGDYETEKKTDEESGAKLLITKTEVTADMVSLRPDDYFCQCTAWALDEQRQWVSIFSEKGYVRAAEPSGIYIQDQFELNPESLEVYFEDSAEFACVPPAGNPTPRMYWMKDGERIDTASDPNFVIHDQYLIIEYVRVKDEGIYTCIAENEAGTKASSTASLMVLGKPTTQQATGSGVITTTETSVDETRVESTTGATVTDKDGNTFEPYFEIHPESINYVTKDLPAELTCTAIGVKTVVFVCNGEVLQASATTGYLTTDPSTMVSVRENSLVVTRDDVENYAGTEPYTCLCRGYLTRGGDVTDIVNFDSEPAVMKVAFLRNRFAEHPADTMVPYLGILELSCTPPTGNPEPAISWQKDGITLQEDGRIRFDDGNLIIQDFVEHDVGYYVCIAENIARMRSSDPAYVAIGDDSQIVPPKPTDKAEPEPEPETTHSGVQTLPIGAPYISKDLHSIYYVVKNRATSIICEAYDVDFITFSCGMQNVEVKETKERVEAYTNNDGQMVMQKIVEATIDVSKADLENYGNDGNYWCQCYGHYQVPGMDDYQVVSSKKGHVEVSYLKKNFQKEPENQRVDEGSLLSIPCQPPVGNPKPKVTWTKDGENVELLNITPDGSLIFTEARLDDTGEYQCIAENDAGRRSSAPILVEVLASQGGGGAGVEGVGGGEDTTVGQETWPVDVKPVEGVGEGMDRGEGEGEPEINVVEGGEAEPTGEPASTGKEDDKVDVDETVGEPDSTGKEGDKVDVDETVGEPDAHAEDNVDVYGEPIPAVSEGGAEGEVEEGGAEGWDGDEDKDGVDGEVNETDNEAEVEGGRINVIGEGGGMQGSDCSLRFSNCMNILPPQDDPSYCDYFETYKACIADYKAACADKMRAESMDAVDMAMQSSQLRCAAGPSCRDLEECKMVYSNSPDISASDDALPIENFCSEVSSFVSCVDSKLAKCNVTMASPQPDVKISLLEVGDWFMQYCNKLILGSYSLAHCDQMKSCDINIGQVAGDNSTYWCRFMNSLVTCTAGAVNSCGLDELRNDLEDLHMQANQESCSAADVAEGAWPEGTWPEGEPEPGVEPEPKGEGEPEGEAEPEGTTGEGHSDDDDGDDNEPNMEVDLEGKEGKAEMFEEEDVQDNAYGTYPDIYRTPDQTFDVTEENPDREHDGNGRDIYTNNQDTFYYKWDDYNAETVTEDSFYKQENDENYNRDHMGVKNEIHGEKEMENDNFDPDGYDGFNPSTEDEENFDNRENVEGQRNMDSTEVEASKDPDSGSPVLYSSALLATTLQLLVAAILSRR